VRRACSGSFGVLVEEAECELGEELGVRRQSAVEGVGVRGHGVAPVPARRAVADDVGGGRGCAGQDRRQDVAG
jgi:hypothetical protein